MATLPVLPPCVEGNEGSTNLGVGATFLTICVILTTLRIYVRTKRMTAGLWWDDACIVFAMVSMALGER